MDLENVSISWGTLWEELGGEGAMDSPLMGGGNVVEKGKSRET